MYVSLWAKTPALGALALKTCGANNGGVENALLIPPAAGEHRHTVSKGRGAAELLSTESSAVRVSHAE